MQGLGEIIAILEGLNLELGAHPLERRRLSIQELQAPVLRDVGTILVLYA